MAKFPNDEVYERHVEPFAVADSVARRVLGGPVCISWEVPRGDGLPPAIRSAIVTITDADMRYVPSGNPEGHDRVDIALNLPRPIVIDGRQVTALGFDPNDWHHAVASLGVGDPSCANQRTHDVVVQLKRLPIVTR